MKKIRGFMGLFIVVALIVGSKLYVDYANENHKNTRVVTEDIVVEPGGTYYIKYSEVPEYAVIAFSSSDREVASVAKKGLKVKDGNVLRYGKVTAKKEGQARIKVSITYDDVNVVDYLNVNVASGFDETE